MQCIAFDLFIQPFRDGESTDVPYEPVRSVLNASGARRERDHVRIEAGGGTADVFVGLEGGSLSSLMVSRHEHGVENLIVTLAQAADGVIMIPGGPTLLTSSAQREHLPNELAANARLVDSGEELAQVIAAI